MKRYSDDERIALDNPPRCYDCGVLYGSPAWVEAVVSDDVWKRINPTHWQGAGILCVNCIAARCIKAGLIGVQVKLTAGPLIVDTRELEESQELARVEWELFQQQLQRDYSRMYKALMRHAPQVGMDVIRELEGKHFPYESYPTGVKKWLDDLQRRSVELDEMIEWNDWLGKRIRSLMQYLEALTFRPDCPRIFRKQVRAQIKAIEQGE